MKEGFFVQNNYEVNGIDNDDLNLLEEKYNQVVSEICLIKEKLSSLREKSNLLLESKYKKNKTITIFIAALLFLLLVNLGSYLSMQLGYYLKFFCMLTNSQATLICVVSILTCSSVIGIVDIFLSKKIIEKKQRDSYNKIVNSSKYRELMDEIRKTSSVLDDKISEKVAVRKEMLECKSRSAIVTAQMNIKQVLNNYQNLDIDRGLVDFGNKSKPLSRRLVRKNRKYVEGNIE